MNFIVFFKKYHQHSLRSTLAGFAEGIMFQKGQPVLHANDKDIQFLKHCVTEPVIQINKEK